MAFVYWVHLPEHTDMFKEGYVGYTSRTVEVRWKHHLKEARNPRFANYPIYNAIRKYGDKLVVSTILEGPEDYCLDVEHKLRPEMKIGWNLQMGGNKGTKGVDVTAETRAKISAAGKGRKFSEEHRRKLSLANRSRTHTYDTRQNMSIARKGISRSKSSCEKQAKTLKDNPWKNSKANKQIWANASELYTEFLKVPDYQLTEFSRIVGISLTSVQAIFKKFKSGWNPAKDVNWLAFVEEYKLKEATKCHHIVSTG